MRDPIDILQAALARPGAETSDFELNPGFMPLAGRKLRPAGVLVPVSLVGAEPRLILTKRSSALRHHPGQVAFPGGKQEDEDADVTATALREAEEEIGLPRGLPKILGHLSEHETGTGFKVTPVLAVLERAFEPVAEPGEVEDVFSVPLAHVLNPENYLIESRQWQGGRRYYFTVPCGPYYIWGATARMLRGLALRAQA
ncbi:MAG: CoA pyrophosphatase [Pseudodonghicola sp.]|nr:CoA pyrophosphatase [Pseudodonghicola sp.]